MGRRLILGTNVLIAYERGSIDHAALDADELPIAAVSIAEYRIDHDRGAEGSFAMTCRFLESIASDSGGR